MNMVDLIKALSAGQNPEQAILASASATQPPAPEVTPSPAPVPPASPSGLPGGEGWTAGAQVQPVPPQIRPPIPPVGTTPKGQETPVTNPTPVSDAPKALQSPPDLSNMYLSLMRQNQNAAAMDSGLTLIAAGLTPHAATRAALINASGGCGGAGKGVSSADIINLQKAQQEQQTRLQIQSMKAGLMKQHGLTSEQFDVLANSGKMDEFVKEAAGKGLTVQEAPDGSKAWYNHRGEKVFDMPGKKTDLDERQLERINADRVAAGKPPMTTEEFIQLKKPAGTTVYVSPDGTHFQPPEKGYDYERTPDGKVKIGANGQPTLYKIPGGKPADEAAEKTREQAELAVKEGKEKVGKVFASSNVGNAVQKALDNVDKFGAADWASIIARKVPVGNQSWNVLDSALKTIDANTAFETLKQMRDASKSGASGLGQVTDTEQQMLKSVIANLSPHQGKESLREGLLRVKVATELLANQSYTDPAKFQADMSTALAAAVKEERDRRGVKATPDEYGIKPRQR